MRRFTRKVLALARPAGEIEYLKRAVELVPELDVDAVVIVGDLAAGGEKGKQYRQIFKALGAAPVPSFYVPGPGDAPVEEYLREAYNMEIVFPYLHSVHGSLAFAPGHVLVAGMGGDVRDKNGGREEVVSLSYPAWEVEYRLKVISELKDYQKIMLFSRMPAHKGLHESGSEALAELVKTHNPRLVVAYDPAYRTSTLKHEWLGKSLVVAPGSLAEGDFSVVDLHEASIETGNVR
jgi:Icc-related predicted phosphoesterase